MIIDEVITDFSWAAINAICRSFNGLDFKKYLDTTYNIIVLKQHKLLDLITAVQLCSSHITKNMKNDVFASFKNKDEAFFIAAVIGGIFDLHTYDEIDDYIKKFFTILLSQFETDECTKAKEEFEKFSTIEKWNVNDILPDETENEFEASSIIYKDSKFYQKYSEFIFNFKGSCSSKLINPHYNPRFVAVMMKKYIAFLPLWTSILTSLRSSNFTRANNGIIEGKKILNLLFINV